MTKEELIDRCEQASLEWTREELLNLCIEIVEFIEKDRQE